MSLKILIGKNKTGKTRALTESKKEHESNNKTVLYIPSVIDLNNYIEKEKSGTKINDPKTPHFLFIEFINKIISINKTVQYTLSEMKIINKNHDELKGMKKIFLQKSENDIFFEEDIINLLKINEIQMWREVTPENILEFDPKIGRKWDESCSSGSINYSLLKLLGEFINWSKDQNYYLEELVLIIDEPEKFSHPELVQKITDEILNISKCIAVEIATHSEQLVERIYNKTTTDDEIIYTYKGKYKDENEIWNYDSLNLELEKYLNGEFHFREVNSIIKYLFSSNVILIEGIEDREFIESLRIDFFDEYYLTIIDCHGRGGISKIINIIEQLNLLKFIKVLIFYDEDTLFNKATSKWDLPVQHIEIIDNIKSIIQKPDLEKCFYKYYEIEPPNKQQQKKCNDKNCNKENNNEKKPKYEFITKSGIVSKKNLKLDQKSILKDSTIPNAKEKIRKIGQEIQTWLRDNDE